MVVARIPELVHRNDAALIYTQFQEKPRPWAPEAHGLFYLGPWKDSTALLFLLRLTDRLGETAGDNYQKEKNAC